MFQSPSHLKRHINSKHSNLHVDERKQFACPDCQKLFTRKDYILPHQATSCEGRPARPLGGQIGRTHCSLCGYYYDPNIYTDKAYHAVMHHFTKHRDVSQWKIVCLVCNTNDSRFFRNTHFFQHLGKVHSAHNTPYTETYAFAGLDVWTRQFIYHPAFDDLPEELKIHFLDKHPVPSDTLCNVPVHLDTPYNRALFIRSVPYTAVVENTLSCVTDHAEQSPDAPTNDLCTLVGGSSLNSNYQSNINSYINLNANKITYSKNNNANIKLNTNVDRITNPSTSPSINDNLNINTRTNAINTDRAININISSNTNQIAYIGTNPSTRTNAINTNRILNHINGIASTNPSTNINNNINIKAGSNAYNNPSTNGHADTSALARSFNDESSASGLPSVSSPAELVSFATTASSPAGHLSTLPSRDSSAMSASDMVHSIRYDSSAASSPAYDQSVPSIVLETDRGEISSVSRHLLSHSSPICLQMVRLNQVNIKPEGDENMKDVSKPNKDGSPSAVQHCTKVKKEEEGVECKVEWDGDECYCLECRVEREIKIEFNQTNATTNQRVNLPAPSNANKDIVCKLEKKKKDEDDDCEYIGLWDKDCGCKRCTRNRNKSIELNQIDSTANQLVNLPGPSNANINS